MSTPNESNTVVISGGSVEYDLDSTARPIDDMIEALQEAKENGALFVTGLSGNGRGAKYMYMYVDSDDLEFVEDAL